MNRLRILLTFWLFSLPILSPAQEVFESDEGTFTTSKLTNKMEIGLNNRLIIRAAANLPGEVKLSTSLSKDISITYLKKAKAEDKHQAIDYIDLIAVVLDKTIDGVRLEMRAPNPAPWSGDSEWGMVEVVINVPEKCFVDIEAPQFDVDAVGPFKGLVIAPSLGKVDVSSVLEKLEVATSNRRVNVSDISGEISISTTNASLTAKNLVSIGRRCQIENEHGDIRIDGFAGEIEVENSYGRIHITSFRARGSRNVIRSMSGPIMLDINELVDTQLRITNRFEDVEINLPENTSASLSLAVDQGGKIEVSNLDVKPELIEQNRMNLVAGKGTSIITSSVRGSGNIYVRGSND
ncbi:MAG: hypothetical protein ACREBV_05995 [Candidatus Zixiibacteriota bacterium]